METVKVGYKKGHTPKVGTFIGMTFTCKPVRITQFEKTVNDTGEEIYAPVISTTRRGADAVDIEVVGNGSGKIFNGDISQLLLLGNMDLVEEESGKSYLETVVSRDEQGFFKGESRNTN